MNLIAWISLIMSAGSLIFILVMIVHIIRACRSGSGNGQMTDEELRMLREMGQGLETMERRMENLETILNERPVNANDKPNTNREEI